MFFAWTMQETATQLLILHYKGVLWCSWCFPHIINLVAKMNNISNIKKEIYSYCTRYSFCSSDENTNQRDLFKVRNGTRHQQGVTADAPDIPSGADESEAIIEEGDKLTMDEQEISEALLGEEEEMLLNDGQQVYNEKVVQTMKVQTTIEMVKHGVKITPTQSKAVMGIILKAC